MGKLTMYMVTHKSVSFIPEGRTPIFVGNGDNTGRYVSDNTGDHISYKNKNYCELTAFYWIWKNDHSSDYVSIEHYRRFFMNPVSLFPRICQKKRLKGYLEKYNVVTSRYYRFGISIGEYYRQRHFAEDMDVVEDAVRNLYPEYLEDLHSVMNGFQCPMFNMNAMPKELFDTYCQWLFDILFYIEEHVDMSERTDYQKRIFGFLAERMLNVWIMHNHYQAKRLPVYYVGGSVIKSWIVSLKHRIPLTFTPTTPRH